MSQRKSRMAHQEKDVAGQIVQVQQLVERLSADFESVDFRPNKTVSEGIKRSIKAVDAAIEHLAAEEHAEALRKSNIALLHAYFARAILDAEMTEHYLGESNFLEIDGGMSDWKEFVTGEMRIIEEEIVALRQEIAEAGR